MDLRGVTLLAALLLSGCGGSSVENATTPSLPGGSTPAEPDGAASTGETGAVSEPAAESAEASGPKEVRIGGRKLADVDALALEAEVTKLGWQTTGFTFGGTFGDLELFGVAANQDGVRVIVGMTLRAKKPSSAAVKGCPAGKALTTMYSCTLFSGPGDLLHSATDEDSAAFLFVTNEGGANADNTRSLFEALVEK